jgi:hypothetical protein
MSSVIIHWILFLRKKFEMKEDMKEGMQMQVQKYLKEFGIEALKNEFSIKVKEYEEGLLVLNYDQINSPKSHPIVKECRSLILDKEFNVVSRSMDRFFNLGEVPESQEHIDMSKAVLFEKVDGSLIKIYNWKGTWYASTRSTAFGESTVNGFDITFKELVLKALDVDTEDEFQFRCNCWLDVKYTYICEVTSIENRCVKSYSGYSLYYLSARNNATFSFDNFYTRESAITMGMLTSKLYYFDSIESCIQAAKELKNLDEGYVLYQDGIPVCKIKSPTYCAVHLIKGEGLSPKRIAELVLTGEQDEYLTYFPEDKSFIQPYAEGLQSLLNELQDDFDKVSSVYTQKDFAIAVKGSKASGVLFKMKQTGKNAKDTFNCQNASYKLKTLLDYVY